jgi:hypothetical protein
MKVKNRVITCLFSVLKELWTIEMYGNKKKKPLYYLTALIEAQVYYISCSKVATTLL